MNILNIFNIKSTVCSIPVQRSLSNNLRFHYMAMLYFQAYQAQLSEVHLNHTIKITYLLYRLNIDLISAAN